MSQCLKFRIKEWTSERWLHVVHSKFVFRITRGIQGGGVFAEREGWTRACSRLLITYHHWCTWRRRCSSHNLHRVVELAVEWRSHCYLYCCHRLNNEYFQLLQHANTSSSSSSSVILSSSCTMLTLLNASLKKCILKCPWYFLEHSVPANFHFQCCSI